MAIESAKASSRWVTRVIPVFLAAALGFATYILVARVCVNYLISVRHETGAAIAILILYFLTLMLLTASYLRTVFFALSDPGLEPLGPLAIEHGQNAEKNAKKDGSSRLRPQADLEARRYCPGPDLNPDSPGLERFYSKDVFACESDGRPTWCSACCNWKPDRVHHSNEINRCVRRMDHYCPWAGGMIGENSFKFFTQFTMYTTCCCGVGLGATGYSVRSQLDDGLPLDGFLVAGLALGAFFGLFASLMSVVSWRYIWVNTTAVDMLGARTKVYQLAVRVPRETKSTDKFYTVSYPLPERDQSERRQDTASAPGWAADGRHMRDTLATRTFAILKTEPGENPWDLGFYRNWKSVMGDNALDWFLPFRKSPLCNHENSEGFYQIGTLLKYVRRRYGLPDVELAETELLEMRELNGNADLVHEA